MLNEPSQVSYNDEKDKGREQLTIPIIPFTICKGGGYLLQTYYVGSKMYEEVIGPRSSIVFQEKTERGNQGKRRNDEVIER